MREKGNLVCGVWRRSARLLLLAAVAPVLIAWSPPSSLETAASSSRAPTTESASQEEIFVGLPINLPESSEVKDPVFAVLIGLIETESYGTLTQAHLQMHLQRTGRESRLPYRSVKVVHRFPGKAVDTAVIDIEFEGPLDLPVPYSILGYHPGSFRASRRCVFHEWILGDVELEHREKKDESWQSRPVRIENAHLYGLVEGEVSVDIDGWLDRLLGGKLDDSSIVGLMLGRYDGEILGFALGYNPKGKGRSGALSFERDKILFPSPPEIKTIGRTMRSRVERLVKVSPVEVLDRFN